MGKSRVIEDTMTWKHNGWSVRAHGVGRQKWELVANKNSLYMKMPQWLLSRQSVSVPLPFHTRVAFFSLHRLRFAGLVSAKSYQLFQWRLQKETVLFLSRSFRLASLRVVPSRSVWKLLLSCPFRRRNYQRSPEEYIKSSVRYLFIVNQTLTQVTALH